jgi:C-terminal processing protease CtpA/Prc
MTALALIGRDGVRSFGQPTAGFTTANRVERLADGAILAITVSKVSARDGVAINGPIRPDIEVPLAEAESAALAWLRESC